VNTVFVENLAMDDPRIKLAILIKSNSYRGGTVRDIYMRNIRVTGVQGTAVMITYHFGTPNLGGPYRPVFDNINLASFTCQQSRFPFNVRGYPDNRIGSVTLTDCAFRNVAQPGLNVQNVARLTLTRVTVNGRLV
jgi:hypothetical protein